MSRCCQTSDLTGMDLDLQAWQQGMSPREKGTLNL